MSEESIACTCRICGLKFAATVEQDECGRLDCKPREAEKTWSPNGEPGDLERLIDHIAIVGLELRDNSEVVDASTESSIGLPVRLQNLINKAEEIHEALMNDG